MTPLEMIRANADLFVQRARENLGVSLTIDRTGVEWLDGFLNRMRGHLSPQAETGMISVAGCFFGECLVRSQGGAWIEKSGEWHVQVTRACTISVNVFGKVQKQLTNEDGESVLSMFDMTLMIADGGLDLENNKNIKRFVVRGDGRTIDPGSANK